MHAVAPTAAIAAAAGTAAARFTCTPLTDEERLHAYDLGGYTHKISTVSPESQLLFDQGMALAFNFNREESMRAFEAALARDPDAPMAHWGIAYALGPDLNKAAVEPAADPMDYPSFSPAEMARGLSELQQARQLVEQQLAEPSLSLQRRELLQHDAAYVEALLPVFSSGDTWGPSYRQAQSDYAAALQEIARKYPGDEDALPLAAEAVFDLQPWDAWDPLTKAPVGRALEILDLLNASLARSPEHSLALHLTVHATESLPTGRGPGTAGQGEAAADILAVSKRSFGHLTHMPSHAYHRLGRWKDAVATNVLALEADTNDAKRCLAPYMPMHNLQVLLMGAGDGGDLETAQTFAEQFKSFPERFGPTYMVDGRERSMLPLVWARFGQWDKIRPLTLLDYSYDNDGVMMPRGAVPFAEAAHFYTQALAQAAQAASATPAGKPVADDQIQQVEDLVAQLKRTVDGLPPDPRTKPGPGLGMWTSGFNMAGRHLLQVAEGRLDLLRGDAAAAEAHLQEALKVESEELYAEPSYFYQPARQCLGAVLLHQGRYDEAAKVYQQDLTNLPENVWSLAGLREAKQHLAAVAGHGPAAAPDAKNAASQPKTSCPAYFS